MALGKLRKTGCRRKSQRSLFSIRFLRLLDNFYELLHLLDNIDSQIWLNRGSTDDEGVSCRVRVRWWKMHLSTDEA